MSVLAAGNGTGRRAQALTLMTAQYNADGRLLDISRAEKETEEEKAFRFQTEPTEIQGDTACVKAFLWERNSMKPLLAEAWLLE